MFLAALEKQNPQLMDTAVDLWRQGKILPDSYVIDTDQLLMNARLLLTCARQYNIKLYGMTKQIGRNPWVCRELLALGYEGIVAVDFKEARQLYHHGIPVAHIGHLVQPPDHMLDEIIRQKPQVITVYSIEKARQIAAVAEKLHVVQPLLLKVYQNGDLLYPGQEAGFPLTELPEVITSLQALKSVVIVGATHFPCMLFDHATQKTVATENLSTLLKGIEVMRQQGIDVQQINAPSATSCETLPQLANYGATHGEPGHALTGTSPANVTGEQPEKVALLYLSEISHHYHNFSYCFGGGYYRRSHVKHAVVYAGKTAYRSEVIMPDASSIDYHLSLAGNYPIGSPVIMCFRSQIFVTRSDVVLVSGIQSGQPKLMGIYDSLGNLVSGALDE